ncbi:hypothetical protein [Spiroplasma chrysopicola]|uniref:Uncharacterized protein n=1 Tax=Spiroplasma chrysopicola DF-1 TaxID=1276227 RepID=R4UIU3_9MOLU|nr:hypothetical protein [Spiroplasma chrysopicola]AGM25226.1 hypothetical protein SCHRY_v1c06500 [Spiroplasma chrysopicola DF-1]
MDDKAYLSQHYQNDLAFINKLKGWCEQAKRGQIVTTDFITLAQLNILRGVFKKAQIKDYTIHCPFLNSYRVTVTVNSTVNNTQLLVATQPKDSLFKHNVLVGYFLNHLQLDQKILGDLYLSEDKIYLSVLTKNSPIFLSGPLECQNRWLEFTLAPGPVEMIIKFKTFSKVTQSLRLDAIVSAICNLSRTMAQTMIKKEMVYVDFSVNNRRTFNINYGMILSIKKYGRFLIQDINQLKNDNFRIEIAKYE